MALAFYVIFDELPTPSRSKMAAILAKRTKIEVLPGGSKFLGKKTRPAIALRLRPNNADPTLPSVIWMCWAFHFTYGRAGGAIFKELVVLGLRYSGWEYSDFRLGSRQSGARIWTQNHPQQQQWAHSRRFESEAAWLKG